MSLETVCSELTGRIKITIVEQMNVRQTADL